MKYFKKNLYRSAPRIHDACASASRLAPHVLGPYAPQCASALFKTKLLWVVLVAELQYYIPSSSFIYLPRK